MPPRRVLGPGGRRTLGPGGKKTGGGGGAGGGGSSDAVGAARERGRVVALKKGEKYGFIKREAPAERGERPLYFRFEDCDCDASRLRENDDVTFAASDAPDDGKFGKRAFHVELDLVRTTEADPGRYGHVDSVLASLRVHDGAAVERNGSRLGACDVTEATRWAVGLADRGADGVVLRQDEVLDALRRDDWPLVGVAAFLPAWKSTAGLGRPDQILTCSRSVNSTSIRLIFGRNDCSRRVLEARPKSLRRNCRIRAH